MKALAISVAAVIALAISSASAQTPAPRPSAPAPAAAAQMDAPVIAVIDVNEVMQRSKAGKAMTPQFEKLKKGYEDQLNRNRDALNEEGKQLEGQRAVLAPEAFAQRVNQLRQKEQALGQEFTERKRTLDATLSSNVAQIRNVMFEVSAEIARERGINVILPKETVVIIARNLEITDEVLRRLDQKLPNFTLKLTKPPSAAASGQAPAAAAPRQPRQ